MYPFARAVCSPRIMQQSEEADHRNRRMGNGGDSETVCFYSIQCEGPWNKQRSLRKSETARLHTASALCLLTARTVSLDFSPAGPFLRIGKYGSIQQTWSP